LDLAARDDEDERAFELYRAMFLMAGVLESSVGLQVTDENLIQAMLDVSKRSWVIALAFRMAEHYTLCVYKAEKDTKTGKDVLRCIASDRTKQCALKDARQWLEGVGVTGACYSRAHEIIVPDVSSVELGSLYGVNQKSDDEEKYVSLAAAPILIGDSDVPWGVVTATSDRAGHFKPDEEPTLQAAEGVRGLSAMVALAVKQVTCNCSAKVAESS
jgi:hypothetical protein